MVRRSVGENITLTAAQVDSGLTLNSYYRGGRHPEATLTLTANAKDPVTGAVTSAAPQTITVANSRSAAMTDNRVADHQCDKSRARDRHDHDPRRWTGP